MTNLARTTTSAAAALSAADYYAGLDQHQQALSNLARAAADVEQATRAAVMGARVDGRTWGEIGAALGITRQAAQQRFGR